MTTADIAQLFTGFATLATTLGGVAAYIAARVRRTQREQAAEIKALRQYAVAVARWGFEVQFAAAGRGMAVPVMPRPPWEELADEPDPEPPPRAPRHSSDTPTGMDRPDRPEGATGAAY